MGKSTDEQARQASRNKDAVALAQAMEDDPQFAKDLVRELGSMAPRVLDCERAISPRVDTLVGEVERRIDDLASVMMRENG